MPHPASTLLRRMARGLMSIEGLLLALLLPAVLTISPRTLPLLLLLPFLWAIRRFAHGHFIPRSPLNATLLLLLILILVNLWATVDLSLSLAHISGALYGVALYFAVLAFALRSVRRFHTALILYLALGLLLAAGSLIATDWQPKLPVISAFVPYLPNVVNAINPNYLAGALLWLAPLPLALLGALPGNLHRLRQKVGDGRAIALVLATCATAAFLLAILILTQSRSGLLGLVAAIAFISLVLLRRRRRLLILLLFLCLIVAILLVIALPSTFWNQLAGISDGASLGEPATVGLDSRLEIWRRALYAIEDFPITGMGMGTFDHVVRLLYPIYITGTDSPINHAHNHLLQTAVDLGIPGLIAYLALWFGAAAMLLTVWRNAQSPWHHALALGFSASLISYLVYGLTEAIPLGGRPGFIFWYLLALITVLHHHTSQSPSTTNRGAPMP